MGGAKHDGGSGSGGGTPQNKCGLTELVIFVAAVAAGTACSVCSKTMMSLHGVGITGEVEKFSKPLFQTFGMFVGMTFGLVMHWAVLQFQIPFPGYHLPVQVVEADDEDDDTEKPPTTKQHEKVSLAAISVGTPNNNNNNNNKQRLGVAKEQDALLPKSAALATSTKKKTVVEQTLPTWMYFFLAIPSIFDLLATILCMCGLRYINVSIYQMLRGSGIIFVALMKQHVLKDHLYKFQWVGVLGNVASVVFVGATAILASEDAASANSNNNGTGKSSSSDDDLDGSKALLGVLFVMMGAFVQSLQFIFEEKVMTMDIPSPPLLLIGMEGLWGTILCVFVMYPLAYYLPGDDHGSYENPWNTWAMIQQSTTIQTAFVIYFVAIFLYNLFAALVTFLLNSIWHAILDNFRPITVWTTDLVIYYVIVHQMGDLGEPWTKWSFIQLTGMFVLFWGTAGT
jgi:hypothetical protein